MTRRLMLVALALASAAATQALAATAVADTSMRSPLPIVRMHVHSSHGVHVRVRVRPTAILIRIAGNTVRSARLLVDGRRARTRPLPFQTAISRRGLRTGAHRIMLVAADRRGLSQITFAVVRRARWSKVTPAAPTLRFLTQPPARTTKTDATFSWRTGGSISRTVCRLDDAVYRSCVQPVTLHRLSAGAHTYDVQVTGRGHSASARARWTVTQAPGSDAGATQTSPGASTAGGVPGGAPFAAGASAGNLQLGPDNCTSDACVLNKRFLLRWVARHAGVISTLYLEFIASGAAPYACPTGQNGYGGGTSGTALISTYPVSPDGTPDTSRLLARTELTPCAAATGGSVGVPLAFETSPGQEFATVVQNIDASPLTNSFSINGLYYPGGLVGANGRNERSGAATDAFYGLDPRELVGSSWDGGATWNLPQPNFVPTYVQVYADGYRDGQPYLYATCPCPGTLSGTQTMSFPNVPVEWTITQLGAYTTGPGSARVDLLVNDKLVGSATLSGAGMLRASIAPVTVARGSTVKVRTTAGSGGLALQRIDADTAWKLGPVLTLGAGWRWKYLEQQGGGAADRAVVTVYPLPMYPTG